MDAALDEGGAILNLATLSESPFYKAGGNLSPDDPCYVDRPADMELFEAVGSGQYCYVLTSRQMGKSSLMHRTAVRLRAEGVTPVLVDLTAIGTQVTPEQWYYGMLAEIARQLSLGAEMQAYWEENSLHSPLYRFTHAMLDVVVARTETPLVIFIDEIDSVASIKKSFSTDEFFAAIRQCYNSRASSPEMQRLTFCLLGVSTPADLIQDVSTTPFNIGRQIELTDFTFEEAQPLMSRLDENVANARLKLKRIFHWTNGHPYLTQKICLEVSRDRGCQVADVDGLCQQLFLTNRVRTSEDNLIFVHKLLRTKGDAVDNTAMLRLYRSVLSGKRVANVPSDPLIANLRLAGVVRAEGGFLRTRNLIYSRVFDKRWVNDNMPDAELRRERAAYRRGVLSTVAIAAAVLLVVGVLLYRAVVAERHAGQEHVRLVGELARSNYQRGLDDLTLAQVALQEPNGPRAVALLDDVRSTTHSGLERSWAWRYLWSETHRYSRAFTGLGGAVLSLCPLGDSRLLSMSADGYLRTWDVGGGRLKGQVRVQHSTMTSALSADTRLVAASEKMGSVDVFETSTGRRIFRAKPSSHRETFLVSSIAFTRSSRQFVCGAFDGSLTLFDIDHESHQVCLLRNGGAIASVDVSIYDRVAAGYFLVDKLAIVSGIGSGELCINWIQTDTPVFSVKFSPDGRKLAIGGDRGLVELYDVHTRQRLLTLRRQGGAVGGLAFTPNGNMLATSVPGASCELWDLNTGQNIGQLVGLDETIRSQCFLNNERELANGTNERAIRIWDTSSPVTVDLLKGSDNTAALLDDRTLIVSRGNDVYGYDLRRQRVSWRRTVGSSRITDFSVSQDRQSIVLRDSKGLAQVLNASTGSVVARFTVGVDCVATPDVSLGRVFVAFSNRQGLHVLRLPAGREVLTRTDDIPTQVSFSPIGNGLVALFHNSLKLCSSVAQNAHTWTDVKLSGRVDERATITYSHNGSFLALVNRDGSGFIVQVSTAKETSSIVDIGGRQMARYVTFGPDGTELVTASYDGTIHVWDALTGQEILVLAEPSIGVQSIVLTQDKLVCAVKDGTIKTWSAQSGQVGVGST